jgi:16S rRNA (guanine966-N2)-methyltransferase
MRIIAGAATGATLKVPSKGTRPMTGRARESLFSIIANRLPEADVLDLFAGSGSLGLEALSRGAATALFVESDRSAAAVVTSNIATVRLGGSVITAAVAVAIPRLKTTFDIVFVDPPYADEDSAVDSVVRSLDSIVAAGGLVVVHRQGTTGFTVPEFLTSIDQRHYGDAVITMMERIDS